MKVKLPGTHRKSRIEMLPLMDMIFLLLAVFIYTMLSMAVHRGLNLDLPQSTSAVPEKQLILSVSIDENGLVYIDKQAVEIDKLTETLFMMTHDKKDPGLLLFAEKNIPYQELFRVLDKIKDAGLTRISLQAEAE
ncbi:MAG: biopolymer transporter ExbD [Deltaproteobacteria bacterium]|jgi:biopolymer transport protein ExbD|nr:biopolymer transporter ExbD [Deltaproteobacteria bacterium]